MATIHSFDHTAFDLEAFDTDSQASLFGGVPRPFFSYSGERLAWSQRPLIPPLLKQPGEIFGQILSVQPEPVTLAKGVLELVGRSSHLQREQRTRIAALYTPLAIVGEVRSHSASQSQTLGLGTIDDPVLAEFVGALALLFPEEVLTQ